MQMATDLEQYILQSFFSLLGFLLKDRNELKVESISVIAYCYCDV